MILGNSLDCMVIVQYPDLQLTQLKALPKIPKKDTGLQNRFFEKTQRKKPFLGMTYGSVNTNAFGLMPSMTS